MGGTMRSPLTSMIFALELTQDLNLLPGLLVGCIAAHGITVLLLRRSILTEKVARRGYHIMREYSVDPLTMVRVGEVMDKTVYPVPAGMQLNELSERIAAHDPQIARHEGCSSWTKTNNLPELLLGATCSARSLKTAMTGQP